MTAYIIGLIAFMVLIVYALIIVFGACRVNGLVQARRFQGEMDVASFCDRMRRRKAIGTWAAPLMW